MDGKLISFEKREKTMSASLSPLKDINMKNIVDKNRSNLPLYQVVENSIKNYIQAAKENSNSLINNVNAKLNITVDETVVGSVISGLLHAAISHVKDSRIYISAKELYGQMVEINVKDDNCYNAYAVALSLQEVVPLAAKIGGHLNISNQRQKITTISFTFPIAAEQDI